MNTAESQQTGLISEGGSWRPVCLGSDLSVPLCLLLFSLFCPSPKDTWGLLTKNSTTEVGQYYSEYRLPSIQIQNTAKHPACFVKHLSKGAEAALGLFNAALLSAVKRSSSGHSQARKRLCTSASRERETEREEETIKGSERQKKRIET